MHRRSVLLVALTLTACGGPAFTSAPEGPAAASNAPGPVFAAPPAPERPHDAGATADAADPPDAGEDALTSPQDAAADVEAGEHGGGDAEAPEASVEAGTDAAAPDAAPAPYPVGWPTSPAPSSNPTTLDGAIQFQRFAIAQPVTLLALHVWTMTTSGKVGLALYADGGGAPASVVAYGQAWGQATCAPCDVALIPSGQTALPAGTYWLAATTQGAGLGVLWTAPPVPGWRFQVAEPTNAPSWPSGGSSVGNVEPVALWAEVQP